MKNRIALVALALIASTWLPAVTRASDATMEPIWKRYWMAVAAEGQCENRRFTAPEYDAMTHVINSRVNNEIGAGPRTHLIDEAKSDVSDRVFKYGCQDQQISDLLNLYRSDLEPALQ